MPSPTLFSPIEFRGLTLRNRVIIPPMIQCSAVDGFANDWHIVNAGKFAAGGAGLVIIESTKVERRGAGTLGNLGLWKDEFVGPLSRVARFIKSNGAAAGIQLGHTGRKGRTHRPWDGDGPIEKTADIPDWDQWEIVGPSPIPHGPGYPIPRELTTSEVAGLIESFGNAAVRANNAGFDVVEIHAAHGYLIHQFLSEYSNQRKDRYGGSEENRMRFLLETVEHVRGIWPSEKPLFVRLSIEDDNGWTVKESITLARLLKSKGVDVIDCSSGGFQLKSTPRIASGYKLGYQVPLAEQIRKAADIATIAVGLIVHGDQAENILQSGSADLIAVGRESLYNPNWPMDAAQKLGVDPEFKGVAKQFGYYLAKRSQRDFGSKPSTYQIGLSGS